MAKARRGFDPQPHLGGLMPPNTPVDFPPTFDC